MIRNLIDKAYMLSIQQIGNTRSDIEVTKTYLSMYYYGAAPQPITNSARLSSFRDLKPIGAYRRHMYQ